MSLMNEFDYEQLTFINLLQTLTSNLLTCKNIEITYGKSYNFIFMNYAVRLRFNYTGND